MELGLLNLMTPTGAAEDAGASAPGAVDGDAFTKLLAQLGLAPATGEDAASMPQALAAKLAAGVVPATAAEATDPGEATPESADKEDGTKDTSTEQTGPLDLAALGLPPLLAALVTPAAAAPAVQSASATIAETPASAGTAVPLAPAALQQLAEADVQTPPVSPKAELAGDKRAAPVEMSARLAALVSAVAPRGMSSTSAPAGPASTERPTTSDAPAAPLLDTASIDGLRTPSPLAVFQAAPTEPTSAIAAAPEPAGVAELMVEQQLDLASGGEWLDQLAKDIARTASTDGQLRFKLNPEHLGSLHVELTQGAGGASVRLTADTEAARTIIADARPQLIAEARAQGVRIAEAHVDLGSGGQSGNSGNGSRDGRTTPEQTYLTTWKPESVEEGATPPRRSASERYA